MSDIGLKGVAGFVVVVGGLALSLSSLGVAVVAAAIVARRGQANFARTFGRIGIGPLAATAAALLALAWAWDGPNELVDRVSPAILGGIIAVGVTGGVMARRRQRTRPARRNDR